MAYSSDSFRKLALETETEENRFVIVTCAYRIICTRPSDTGSRTEQMLESLLTKVTSRTDPGGNV